MDDSALERMLNAIDSSTANGARDYAIMVLMMAYGLRGVSVAELLLDDIDWQHSRIRIRAQKGGKEVVLPLMDSVGDALIHYLRHRFDKTPFREVFLTVKAPVRPLNSLVVSRLVRGYMHKAGIKIVGAGSRTLRSSCTPAALTKATTIIAFAQGATASGSTPTLVKGASKIMAWTKAKTAIAFGIAAILVAGTATTAMVHHNHHAVEQTDFQRSSWKNAAYADPVSAFETTFWATSRSDGKTVFYSLTPDLQQSLEQRAKHAAGSPEECLSQNQNSADHLNGITGFHILKSEMVSDNEVRLHLSIGGNQMEQTYTMKRIGKEWKMDGFPSGF
jgi:hypothetical protein